MDTKVERFRLQRLGRDDADWVFEIERSAHVMPWSLESIAQALPFCLNYKLIDENNRGVAYIMLSVAADQAEVVNFAVDPEHQGQGLGSRLLAHALQQLRAMHVKEVFLEVRQSNDIAQALYHKFHFEDIGIRRDYYSAPSLRGDEREDALLMRCTLNAAATPA